MIVNLILSVLFISPAFAEKIEVHKKEMQDIVNRTDEAERRLNMLKIKKEKSSDGPELEETLDEITELHKELLGIRQKKSLITEHLKNIHASEDIMADMALIRPQNRPVAGEDPNVGAPADDHDTSTAHGAGTVHGSGPAHGAGAHHVVAPTTPKAAPAVPKLDAHGKPIKEKASAKDDNVDKRLDLLLNRIQSQYMRVAKESEAVAAEESKVAAEELKIKKRREIRQEDKDKYLKEALKNKIKVSK